MIDALAVAPIKGSIWFNTTNNSINVKTDTSWDSFSGFRNVSYANYTLTFTKADGTTVPVKISEFDTLVPQVTQNTSAIANMLGDDQNVDGSPTTTIRQIVIDELANQLLEGGPEGTKANESFETLKELAA